MYVLSIQYIGQSKIQLHDLLDNWNSTEMGRGAGMENGNRKLQKSLLFIGFFTSEAHRIV